MKIAGILILVSMCSLTRCSRNPLDKLDTPQQLTLYSVDGRDFEPGEEPKTDEKFHGYPVLGKVEITEEGQRRDLIAALKVGIDLSDGKLAACFWPRHAIRMVRENQTTDLVICFECYQLRDYKTKQVKTITITRDPQPLFDKTLQEVGIKLAPKSKQE